MTRTVVAIVLVAALAVVLALAVSERRVQAAFDAMRQADEELKLEPPSLSPDGARKGEPPRPSLSPDGARKGEPPRPSPSPDGARKGEPPRPSPSPDGARKGEPAAATAQGAAAAVDTEGARVAEARRRTQANREVAAAQHEALTTLRWALPLAALVTLLLGLGLSLRLVVQVTQLTAAAERIARGKLDAAVPPMKGPFERLAPTLRRTASALARREREADALTAIAALPSLTNLGPARDLGPAHDPARSGHEAAQLGRLLESVRQAIAGVLDVRALTLVAVDGERVRRLATSQRDRQAALYARAGSAVAAMLVRGDAIVFDVDRGVHPEDATARGAGARAYAVLPLDRASDTHDSHGNRPTGALVVDLGLCAVAVAELRFLGLVAHELAARLGRTTLDHEGLRVAELGRASRSQ